MQGTIASVSLGAPAKMSFRRKIDCSNKDVVTILLQHVSKAYRHFTRTESMTMITGGHTRHEWSWDTDTLQGMSITTESTVKIADRPISIGLFLMDYGLLPLQG